MNARGAIKDQGWLGLVGESETQLVMPYINEILKDLPPFVAYIANIWGLKNMANSALWFSAVLFGWVNSC